MSKFLCNLEQLSRLTADISGMHTDVNKQKMALSTLILPMLNTKNGELWSANKKIIGTHVDPL